MENATKALLIAAAVLIVIMIIGIALKVSGSANSSVKQAETTMSAIEIQTFNSRFTPYIGKNISNNSVIKLECMILKILSEGEKNIKFTIKWGEINKYTDKCTVKDLNDLINETSKIDYQNCKYTVTVEYDSNGLINKVKASKSN